MTEPIAIQWPEADILRFGKRADAASNSINITSAAGNSNIALNVLYGSKKCIEVAGTTETSYINLYGNEVSAITMSADSDKTGSIELNSSSDTLIKLTTENSYGYIDLCHSGKTNLRLANPASLDGASIILCYNSSTINPNVIINLSSIDGNGVIQMRADTRPVTVRMEAQAKQSRFVLSNTERISGTKERVILGASLDDDNNEHNYIEVVHLRSNYYTALDEGGLLLPTKFETTTSAAPATKNETRIEAFDSEFLSYANGNTDKEQYLKQTVPSSYAVAKAMQSSGATIYPFEFIVTDVDSNDNAQFKIRYHYQDGSNKYRDFTLNFADKQDSPSTEFGAEQQTTS